MRRHLATACLIFGAWMTTGCAGLFCDGSACNGQSSGKVTMTISAVPPRLPALARTAIKIQIRNGLRREIGFDGLWLVQDCQIDVHDVAGATPMLTDHAKNMKTAQRVSHDLEIVKGDGGVYEMTFDLADWYDLSSGPYTVSMSGTLFDASGNVIDLHSNQIVCQVNASH